MSRSWWPRLALVGILLHLAGVYLLGTAENIWPPRIHDPMWRIVFGIQSLNGAGLLLTTATLLVLLAYFASSRLVALLGIAVAGGSGVGMIVALVSVGLDYLQIQKGLPDQARNEWALSMIPPAAAGLVLAGAFLSLAFVAASLYRKQAEAASRTGARPSSPIVVR